MVLRPRPARWFPVALLTLVLVGALTIAREPFTAPEARDLRFYWARHYWQAAFDATSAACGVGLLTYDFHADYTAAGRILLVVLGVASALLFQMAVAQILWECVPAPARTRLTVRLIAHPLAVATRIVLLWPIVAWAAMVVERGAGPMTAYGQALLRVTACTQSLGLAVVSADHPAGWLYAILGILGSMSIPLWATIFWRADRDRSLMARRHVFAAAGCLVAYLLAASGLLWVAQCPRGGAAMARPAPGPREPGRPLSQIALLVAGASGAGMPLGSVEPERVSEAGKVVLAMVVLVGGPGGGASGGIGLVLLAATAAFVWGTLRPDRHARPREPAALLHAGPVCVLLMLGLTGIVALGLLVIESRTASPFQPAPSFADGLLDACALVAGGNFSSGLVETITSRNLVSGMRQGGGPDQRNLYAYGMSWAMLGMLTGRVVPLLVLARLGARQRSDDV